MSEVPPRVKLIAALHAKAKQMGLNEESYRDRLERATGKRSARDLSDDEIRFALKEFGGSKHLNPHAAKARAIWIGLYNLGAVEGSDAALDAFAERQVGVAKLAFVGAIDARKITEGLKAMAAREGWTIPSEDEGGMIARRNLLLAQWAKLHALGAVHIADPGALMWWGLNQGVIRASAALFHWKRHELDLAAKKLGQWLRKTKKLSSPVVTGDVPAKRAGGGMTLPAMLQYAFDAGGLDAALGLARAFGGQRVYIPRQADDHHVLVLAAGRAAANAVMREFGGDRHDIPTLRLLRRPLALALIGTDKSANEIAKVCGLHRREVMRLRDYVRLGIAPGNLREAKRLRPRIVDPRQLDIETLLKRG